MILLDTGVLSLVTHPKGGQEAQQCKKWMLRLLRYKRKFAIPEICDYELRRELIRADKLESIQKLDDFGARVTYLPLDTSTMRRAAYLWSDIRKQGRPTTSDTALDADVILGAQALEQRDRGARPVVATTNVEHISRFCEAREWSRIQ